MNEGFIEGKKTDVIYIDFSKVFDKINHNTYSFISLIDLVLDRYYKIELNRIYSTESRALNSGIHN